MARPKSAAKAVDLAFAMWSPWVPLERFLQIGRAQAALKLSCLEIALPSWLRPPPFAIDRLPRDANSHFGAEHCRWRPRVAIRSRS